MEKFTIDITKQNALAKATEKILESVQTKTTKAAINTVNIQAAMTQKRNKKHSRRFNNQKHIHRAINSFYTMPKKHKRL